MIKISLFEGQSLAAFAETFWWTMMHFCWQTLVLGCVVFLLRRWGGAQSAAFRYATACGAIVAIPLVFGVTFVHLHQNRGSSLLVAGRL